MNVSFLRPLFDQPGPWVSVYLDATRAGENADHEVDLRWRALRESLEADGADAATLDAVATALAEHPYQPGRYGLAIFARAGEVTSVEVLPAPPPADQAHVGPLPHAMPLVAQRGEEVPYVRVLADRTGADLDGLSVGGASRHREVDVVTRLQRGQVDTVLLVDDPSSTDTLWIGPDDPTLVSADEHLLRQSGVENPQRVRADAALLRAIAGTGASLVLVAPEDVELEHGIGGVLRYTDGSTAAD